MSLCFQGAIAENITLNNPDIDPERVRRVAEHVNAHHFISASPKQYEEPVTERGSTLSAGQRQFLAFARALAYDPAILILDEATANIDTETEMLIQDVLPALKGRTSLVVAHRLYHPGRRQDHCAAQGQNPQQGTHQVSRPRKACITICFYCSTRRV